jgi:hypothetical protein
MAKNITIYPSNSTPLANRTPHIDYSVAGSVRLLSLSVVSNGGAVVSTFSGSTNGSNRFNSIYVDFINGIISGETLNVKNYFSVGGTQVINATNNWVGPTTNIAGAQGAQGNI